MKQRHFTKKITAVIFTLLILSSCSALNVFAEKNHDNVVTGVPALVAAHVGAMETTKPALLEVFKFVECFDVWDISYEDEQDILLPENIPTLIEGLKKFNGTLKTAASIIEPFLASSDAGIKTAAKSSHGAYQRLMDENESFIRQLNEAIEKSATPEEMDKILYEISSAVGGFSSSLYHASEWVLEAITKTYPNKNLTGFPQDQREDLVRRLEAIYGVSQAHPKISHMEGAHFCNAVVNLYETLKEQPEFRFYSISGINVMAKTAGTIQTEGYVVFISVCPPCPENAVCVPCQAPYVIISEHNKEIQYPDQMLATELSVNTNFKEGLKLGKKYRFTLTVRFFEVSGVKNHLVELVNFEPILN